MFTIAIVGRPNVGKSTLFNKLAGQALAIVNDYAGVTRDRKDAIGYLGDMTFRIIDTAGWENDIKKEKLEFRMIEQTEIAVREADLCLFVVDKKEGLTQTDYSFAEKLRKISTPVILLANKCEGFRGDFSFDKEYYKLGFGEPIGISAEHKDGFTFLYEAILPYYTKFQELTKDLQEVKQIDVKNKDEDDRAIQLTIVGRPNSGKSTLINQLLGEERVITGAEAGITRDSISIDWEYNGRAIKLVDTAGIRKKKNIVEDLEQMSVNESMRAIRFAQVVIMMVDATTPFDSQDLAIISMLIQEGRGIVFALNKWDLVSSVEEKQKIIDNAIATITKAAPEVKGCPIIPISALVGKHMDKLMNAVFEVYNSWNAYISTAKLNNWLKFIQNEHTPPLFKGNIVRLKYITQAKKRPPTFVLFTNSPERLEKTQYDKFIINSLRKDFKLENTVVRLILRKTENPFEDKKDKKHLRNKLNSKNASYGFIKHKENEVKAKNVKK